MFCIHDRKAERKTTSIQNERKRVKMRQQKNKRRFNPQSLWQNMTAEAEGLLYFKLSCNYDKLQRPQRAKLSTSYCFTVWVTSSKLSWSHIATFILFCFLQSLKATMPHVRYCTVHRLQYNANVHVGLSTVCVSVCLWGDKAA